MDLLMAMYNSLTQEEIDEQILRFMQPRHYLKAPVEIKIDNHEIPKMNFECGVHKHKEDTVIKEIQFIPHGKSTRKLF